VNWLQSDRTHLSSPYRIISCVRGFEIWLQKRDQYGVLARELPTLDKAKEFCEAHKAKEAHLLKSLDAVTVK